MNPYDILGVKRNASNVEINKAYRRLVLHWHPDKNLENKQFAENKFKEILAAYEILKDPDKKRKYDTLTDDDQIIFYDMIKKYLSSLPQKYKDLCKKIVNTMYDNNDEFENDLNTFNLIGICGKLFQIHQENNLLDEFINIMFKDHIPNTKIINTTLEDRYLNRFYQIDLDGKNIYLPILNDEIIYQDKTTNILFLVNCVKNDDYNVFNEYDLIKYEVISLSEYLYGGSHNINHFGEIIKINLIPLNKTTIKINNKGLIKDEKNSIRGDLYVELYINGIDSKTNTHIDTLIHDKTEQIIKDIFSPID